MKRKRTINKRRSEQNIDEQPLLGEDKKIARNEANRLSKYNFALFLLIIVFGSCHAQVDPKQKMADIKNTTHRLASEVEKNNKKEKGMETAIIGGGCFWCTEAQYLALDGVQKVISGYAGGSTKNPSYKDVCTGTTGHAEVIKIEYDASQISYADILEAFFIAHDPTQLNRQGADVGTQYRSTIMPLNDEQKVIAENVIKQFNDDSVFHAPVVTTVEPLDTFYPAEDYHQNYYAQNGNNPYCQRVVGPKLEKFKKIFKEKLKH